jgi:hypothetical protein
MEATAHVLFSSDLIKLSDFTCNTPKFGCGCERSGTRYAITIMRRGVHAYYGRGGVSPMDTPKRRQITLA